MQLSSGNVRLIGYRHQWEELQKRRAWQSGNEQALLERTTSSFVGPRQAQVGRIQNPQQGFRRDAVAGRGREAMFDGAPIGHELLIVCGGKGIGGGGTG